MPAIYIVMNISVLNLRLAYLKSSNVCIAHNFGHKSNYSTPLSSQEFVSPEYFWNKNRRKLAFKKQSSF